MEMYTRTEVLTQLRRGFETEPEKSSEFESCYRIKTLKDIKWKAIYLLEKIKNSFF